MESDLDHWHLDATAFDDRVEERHYVSDPARKIRRREQMKIWHIERVLGHGGFGEVRLEKHREKDGDTKFRATKRIGGVGAHLHGSEVEKEMKALLEFSKPKYREQEVFVGFHGWFKNDLYVFLVMEYLPLGDLEQNVVALAGKLPETEARDIAEQILSGLEIMHKEAFAHRDLKPQNVLVVHGAPKWWIKLADFGLTKRLTDTTAYNTRAGTQSYMAPEMLNLLESHQDTEQYTNAVDLWALGCITYRLLTGTIPFPPGRLLMKYCENRSLFPSDALSGCGIGKEGFETVRELLATDPNERPTASQALQSEWFRKTTSVGGQHDSTRLGDLRDKNEIHLESSMSAINFATDTHAGLKSCVSFSTTTSTTGLVPEDTSITKEPIPREIDRFRRKPIAIASSLPTEEEEEVTARPFAVEATSVSMDAGFVNISPDEVLETRLIKPASPSDGPVSFRDSLQSFLKHVADSDFNPELNSTGPPYDIYINKKIDPPRHCALSEENNSIAIAVTPGIGVNLITLIGPFHLWSFAEDSNRISAWTQRIKGLLVRILWVMKGRVFVTTHLEKNHYTSRNWDEPLEFKRSVARPIHHSTSVLVDLGHSRVGLSRLLRIRQMGLEIGIGKPYEEGEDELRRRKITPRDNLILN